MLKALGWASARPGSATSRWCGPTNGAPGLALSGRAAGAERRRAACRRWHVSLTHTDTVAVAIVVAEGAPRRDGEVTP